MGFMQTVAENKSGFTYIPVDPIPVRIMGLEDDKVGNEQKFDIRALLPDNAVRNSVEDIDGEGKSTFGAGTLASQGETLKVTVDYIMADTLPVHMLVVEETIVRSSKGRDRDERGPVSKKFVAAMSM